MSSNNDTGNQESKIILLLSSEIKSFTKTMEAFRNAVATVIDRNGNGDQQLDCVLMASVQKQLAEVANAVGTVRPLAELSELERQECAKTSTVERYRAKRVIYDDDRDSGQTTACFVLKGRCTSVQRLCVCCKKTLSGRDQFVLVRNDGRDRKRSLKIGDRDVRIVYVKMSQLHAGSAFGLGEQRPGRLVIATTDVKCLLVPSAFLAKHNAANIWGRAVCSMNGSDPTVEQSFCKFVTENQWEEYRKSVVDDFFRSRETTCLGQ